jgi:hypothetical protein
VTRALAAALAIAAAAPAGAEVPSVLGGKLVPAGTTAHHVGAGVPGVFYEWWHGGWDYDWALHAGLVYGDWSGAWSDVGAGLDAEVPMRFRLGGGDSADFAFRLAPGLLVADAESRTVFGLRADAGALVSVDVHPRANFITGATVPFTMLFAEGSDAQMLLPVFARLGLESFASRDLSVWLLLELGPVFRLLDAGAGQDRAKFGARFWAGVTFYM